MRIDFQQSTQQEKPCHPEAQSRPFRQSQLKSGSRRLNFRPLLLLAAGIAAAAAGILLAQRNTVPAGGPQFSSEAAALPADLSAGDVVPFGRYEQDNDLSNGPEDITWQVLAVENGRALLISKYALDAKPYHEKWARTTWENCTLRKWLNNGFYASAFNSAEQQQILTVNNKNPDNPVSRIKGGNDTMDQIFLLSFDEIDRYFDSDEARQCQGTDYAKANGSYLNEYEGNSWWWLRSRGSSSKTAAPVLFSGYVSEVGYGVNNDGGYVRPAMWLKTVESGS